MTTALEGVRGQRHATAALYLQERPGTHCTRGWMGPRAGLDRCGKSPPTGIISPDRPAYSQSPYRLSYPAHQADKNEYQNRGRTHPFVNKGIIRHELALSKLLPELTICRI